MCMQPRLPCSWSNLQHPHWDTMQYERAGAVILAKRTLVQTSGAIQDVVVLLDSCCACRASQPEQSCLRLLSCTTCTCQAFTSRLECLAPKPPGMQMLTIQPATPVHLCSLRRGSH